MPTTTTYETWKIDKLKNHRLNAKVFGELGDGPDDKAFVESIKTRGVLEPAVVTADGTLIAGHRRRQGASRAGLKELPVLVRRDLVDEYDVDMAWWDANMNRELSMEQKARWYVELKEIKAKKTAQVQATKGQTGPRPNLDAGRSDEAAAKVVGLKRSTARAAAEVVKAIDTAEASGDTEVAERLRKTLNNGSVSAAKREADELVPPSSNGKPKRKRHKPKEISPAKMVDALLSKHVSPTVKGLDAIAKAIGGKGKNHEKASTALDRLIEALKAMREGKQ